MINNISKGKAQEENLRKDKKDKQNEKNINVKEIVIEEEKSERINYRKSQQMKIKTVWQERAKFRTKSKNSTNENTSQSDNTTTDMSSLSNTVKTLENIRK